MFPVLPPELPNEPKVVPLAALKAQESLSENGADLFESRVTATGLGHGFRAAPVDLSR